MPPSDDVHQLVYFPYLGLTEGEELRFGKLRVWSSSLLPSKTSDEKLRERVAQLLEAHKAPSGKPEKAHPLRGIGVVSRGAVDFRSLVPQRAGEIQELRSALFLACLSDNLAIHGPNAGHYMYTAENFGFVSQGFSLTSPYISETTGFIVTFSLLGYRIGDVHFPTPTYVPRPYPFRHDKELLAALMRVRKANRRLYRRVLDSASLFLESYYNTHAVDVRARVLLQAAAFEVLLDLPPKQQRRVFKDEIERHAAVPRDRKYRYKYETPGGKVPESRTLKGIWADRFYTLRNHIIHGESVSQSEYVFRRVQHHLIIAPVFFVHVVKRLLEEALAAAGETLKFYSLVQWHAGTSSADDEIEEEEERVGFRSRTDHQAVFVDLLAKHGL